MPLNPGYALFSFMLYQILLNFSTLKPFFFKTMPPVMQMEILLAENQVDYDHLSCYLKKNILIQPLHI